MFYDETTDPGLLQALRDWRADDGWRQFHELYAPCIRLHASACGLSAADAEDVLQESMIKIARHLPGFEYDRTVCRFRTWLNQVVHQRICDVYRRQQRWQGRRDVFTKLLGTLEPDLATQVPGFIENELDTEMQRLEVCLARVRLRSRPEHWQIFEAYALHGLTAPQVALRFGTTASKVWVVHHRMVKNLRHTWQKLLDHPF